MYKSFSWVRYLFHVFLKLYVRICTSNERYLRAFEFEFFLAKIAT